MKELWLKYTNEYGEPQRILAGGENFVIGRSPDNDLSIPRSQLSRTHAEINRFSNSYVISDCNSSNGTTLNGIDLFNPAELKNGDRINLGGGIELEVELIDRSSNVFEDEIAPAGEVAPTPDESFPVAGTAAAAAQPTSSETVNSKSAPAAQAQGSMLKTFFIVAPILVVLILIFVGGAILLLGLRKGGQAKSGGDNYAYSGESSEGSKSKIKDEEEEEETPTPKTKETPNGSQTPSNSASNSTSETAALTTVATPAPPSSELDKLERSALPFMRRIAVNDANYVFTQKQLGEINNQIKAFRGSASLRNNLKAVKKDSAQFATLAESKGLKPQFLATAALAKIGNQSQDPLATAQTMLPILGELKITLGNELSDENLLIVAAYELGEKGNYRGLQMTLEGLTKQSPGVASNKIRTIWYLREKGKINDSQYAFALRFLAIGAIMQNPKDFSVDTEAVTF